MKFRPGGFFDLLFNIELKKVGVKIFREISYFSSPEHILIWVRFPFFDQLSVEAFLLGVNPARIPRARCPTRAAFFDVTKIHFR